MLLIKVPVNKSYLPLRFEHIQLPLYLLKSYSYFKGPIKSYLPCQVTKNVLISKIFASYNLEIPVRIDL